MVVEGSVVKVIDQASGREITNNILLQIIGSLEKEAGALLTTAFLTDLIRTAGRSHDPALPQRLQHALKDALPEAPPWRRPTS